MISALELGNSRSKLTRFDMNGVPMGEARYFDAGDMQWQREIPSNDVLRIGNTSGVTLSAPWAEQVVTLSHPWPFDFDCSPDLGIDRCLAMLGASRLKFPELVEKQIAARATADNISVEAEATSLLVEK